MMKQEARGEGSAQEVEAEEELIEYEFRKFVKKSEIPDLNQKEADRKFREIISQLSKANHVRARRFQQANTYLAALTTDNARLLLNGVVEARSHRAASSTPRTLRPAADSYEHPFREMSSSVLLERTEQVGEEQRRVEKAIEKEGLTNQYLTKLLLDEEKSTAKCLRQKVELQSRARRSEQFERYVKEMNKMVSRENFFTLSCRKRGRDGVKDFRRDCAEVLRQKKEVDQAESEVQSHAKREFAELKVSMKYMQERSRLMKGRIEELEKEEDALRNREKESQNVFHLLKALETTCLNFDPAFKRLVEERRVPAPPPREIDERSRISPLIQNKYESMRAKYGAKVEQVSTWMTNIYVEKIREINSLVQKYESSLKLIQDKRSQLDGLEKELAASRLRREPPSYSLEQGDKPSVASHIQSNQQQNKFIFNFISAMNSLLHRCSRMLARTSAITEQKDIAQLAADLIEFGDRLESIQPRQQRNESLLSSSTNFSASKRLRAQNILNFEQLLNLSQGLIGKTAGRLWTSLIYSDRMSWFSMDQENATQELAYLKERADKQGQVVVAQVFNSVQSFKERVCKSAKQNFSKIAFYLEVVVNTVRKELKRHEATAERVPLEPKFRLTARTEKASVSKPAQEAAKNEETTIGESLLKPEPGAKTEQQTQQPIELRLLEITKEMRRIEKEDKNWMKDIFQNIRFTPKEICAYRGKFARNAVPGLRQNPPRPRTQDQSRSLRRF